MVAWVNYALEPSVNASYTGPDGTTASLDQWSRTHTLSYDIVIPLCKPSLRVAALKLCSGEYK